MTVARIQMFKRFCDTLTSTPQTLAFEYTNVLAAADHGFTSETNRQRYAQYIYHLAMFQYGERFTQELAKITPKDDRKSVSDSATANYQKRVIQFIAALDDDNDHIVRNLLSDHAVVITVNADGATSITEGREACVKLLFDDVRSRLSSKLEIGAPSMKVLEGDDAEVTISYSHTYHSIQGVETLAVTKVFSLINGRIYAIVHHKMNDVHGGSECPKTKIAIEHCPCGDHP